ncbi:hypothetical protein ACS0TY_007011 [Phlomoides rotata]
MQTISLSPSFSSYSNCKIAEIAARIIGESDSENGENSAAQRGEGGVSDEEFEFSIVPKDSEIKSPTSADEIFQNGTIRPVYPVFNRDLLLGDLNFHAGNKEENGVRNSVSPKIRLPLRKLFLEERETALTTSESDNLDGLKGESYCAWPPKSASEDLRWQKKKSSSAGGNSKRGKLKDFLRRSNSDGIKTTPIVQFHNSGGKKEIKKKVTEMPAAPLPPPLSNWNGGNKRRSYLSDRQDLAGLFAV